MDIAKYIGLFLLKNHFCYVHGLGNIELRKIPASYDNKTLQGPSYQVVVTPGGSIDDNLANFIAVNEQISISKAANALREYSIQSRKDITAGVEVAIPNIGKFGEQNGKIFFITDPNFQFTPAGVPTIKNSKQLDEQNAKLAQKPSYPMPQKADSVNWSMVVLVVVLLIVVGGGSFGAYYYLNHKTPATPVVVKHTDTLPAKPIVPPVVDSAHLAKDTTGAIKDSTMAARVAAPLTDSLGRMKFKMVIGDYPTAEKADRRIKNLTLIGNHVEMQTSDTANYLVMMTLNIKPSDTTHVKDSLKRLFGGMGGGIVK